MLVAIKSINPRIIIDLKYATADNVVGIPLYSSSAAYVLHEVAQKLDEAQRCLEGQGRGLKIWDAYRPLPVQQQLWAIQPDVRYVADPQIGSAHNRGAAVDVTLVDAAGNELRLPTGFDDFTERAHHSADELSEEELVHREMLCQVMTEVGFEPLATEWWHYTVPHCERYPLLSISFEELQELPQDQGLF